MKYQVIFTDTAKSDLREIAMYLAERSKDKQFAIRFVKELQEETKILEAFPESGAIPRDYILKCSEFRFLTYKDYLLFIGMKGMRAGHMFWQSFMGSETICVLCGNFFE